MIKRSKAASELYSKIVDTYGDEEWKEVARLDEYCEIKAWDPGVALYELAEEYDGKENITFFYDRPDEIEFMMTSSLTEAELLKRLNKFIEQKKATSDTKTEFKAGDICWHPKFGNCKVIKTDSRGLVEVRWPENSSSQSYHSLVDPDTLTKQK